MRRIAGAVVVLLCCAAGGASGEVAADGRLVEAQADFDVAKSLKEKGDYPGARIQAEHALALREAVLGGLHPEVASCLELMGVLSRLQGDLVHAEPLLQRALAIRESALGKDHPNVAQSLNHLASQGRTSALREVMRSWRASPLHLHPHDWAAFISLGRDAPLHDLTPTAPRTSQP